MKLTKEELDILAGLLSRASVTVENAPRVIALFDKLKAMIAETPEDEKKEE